MHDRAARNTVFHVFVMPPDMITLLTLVEKNGHCFGTPSRGQCISLFHVCVRQFVLTGQEGSHLWSIKMLDLQKE